MLQSIRDHKKIQLIIGLIIGIFFGFFLQKGGVTQYDIIIGQLLLVDFTVFKVMLTAVIIGMIGVYMLRSLGLVTLHPKPGSFGTTVIGGLIFGAGFAILGYCPGTVVGAVGQGSMDALFGGVIGMLIGAGIFASIYPKIQKKILSKGYFGEITFPELLKINEWILIIPLVTILVLFIYWMEISGL